MIDNVPLDGLLFPKLLRMEENGEILGQRSWRMNQPTEDEIDPRPLFINSSRGVPVLTHKFTFPLFPGLRNLNPLQSDIDFTFFNCRNYSHFSL